MTGNRNSGESITLCNKSIKYSTTTSINEVLTNHLNCIDLIFTITRNDGSDQSNRSDRDINCPLGSALRVKQSLSGRIKQHLLTNISSNYSQRPAAVMLDKS